MDCPDLQTGGQTRWLPPLLRFVSGSEWDMSVKGPLRTWCDQAGAQLRSVTVQIRDWSARINSNSAEWLRLAGIDWLPIFASGKADVELYVSREIPQPLAELMEVGEQAGPRAYGVVDQTRGLCWLGGVTDYRGVRRAVLETLTGALLRPTRGRRTRSQRWAGGPAAAAEWPLVPGPNKGVIFLGPHVVRTMHGFLLSRYAEGAALTSLDWCFIAQRKAEAVPGDGHLLVPGTFVRLFPSLFSTLVLSESAAPDRYPARHALLAYQAPEDLDRGIASGEVPPEEIHTLYHQVGAQDHWLLVDPEQLVGADHLADRSRVSTWVIFAEPGGQEADKSWLVRPAGPEQVLDTLLRECFAYHAAGTADSARHFFEQLLARKGQRFFVARPDYAVLPTHLIVRFVIAGIVNEARFLQGAELPDEVRVHLGLDWQDGTWQAAGGRDVDVLGMLDDDRLKYVLVLDKRACAQDVVPDPYGMILAVWPGQIADFFTSHRFLNPRRLFSAVLPW